MNIFAKPICRSFSKVRGETRAKPAILKYTFIENFAKITETYL